MLAQSPADPGLVLLSELFPPAVGGSAVLFGEIYSRLGGTVVEVLTDTPPAAAADPGVRVLHARVGCRHWGLLHPHGAWHYLRLAGRLRAATRRAAAVHCGRALPEGVAALLCRRWGGPPYVCWAHGEDITTARTSRELTVMMRHVYRGASIVFANSASTRRLLLDLGVASARTEVVYPGVDVDRFRPDLNTRDVRARLAGSDEILLLSVGRLQARKGHDLVIRALAFLGGHAARVRYAIVGDGPERGRLEALAGSCGVRDRVIFAGEIAADALPQHYAACDIFVLPNRVEQNDIEGFGIVFLEAAAAGKPAIGGRSGGVPEAVLDGVTGLLVDGTDVDELASALGRLVAADALRRELGSAARARAARDFRWERAAEQVAAVHGRMAADARAC